MEILVLVFLMFFVLFISVLSQNFWFASPNSQQMEELSGVPQAFSLFSCSWTHICTHRYVYTQKYIYVLVGKGRKRTSWEGGKEKKKKMHKEIIFGMLLVCLIVMSIKQKSSTKIKKREKWNKNDRKSSHNSLSGALSPRIIGPDHVDC